MVYGGMSGPFAGCLRQGDLDIQDAAKLDGSDDYKQQ